MSCRQLDQFPKPVVKPQASFVYKSMRWLLAVVLMALPLPAQARQLDTTTIDGLVADALQQWQTPGAVVVIVNRERVVYLRGHGVRELGKPDLVTAETLFPLASCTKAFTATLAAMLVDDGKMTWDDPVRKHLPDFRLNDPVANQAVTLRDVLSHRTGLASHDELWYRSPWPVSEQIRRAGFLPLAHEFRKAFHYQSVLYSAAGLATASAGGQSWDSLVRQRIFEPLGMKAAICTSNGPQRAMPHRPDHNGKLVTIPWYEQPQPNPAGSIHLTGNDLVPWLMFHLGDGTWQGKRLISASNLAETHTPQIVQTLEGVVAATHPETKEMSYGLGWVIQDYRGNLLWTHTGLIDGFRAQIALAPQAGYGIAVLSNRNETRMNLALVNTILDRMLGAPSRDWNAYLQKVVADETATSRANLDERDRIRQASTPPRSFAEYVGNYQHPALGDCTIFLSGGSLAWRWRGTVTPMTWDTGDQFHVDVPGLSEQVITFTIDSRKTKSMKLFDVMWNQQ